MPQPTAGAPLRHGVSDRRVLGLRERLLRAGAQDTELAPDAARDPSIFDGHVDRAVRGFQQRKGLIVDGVVGPDTEAALNDAQYTLGDRPLFLQEDRPLHGDDVEELQTNLSLLGFYYGHLDGTFTRQTEYAVKELQSSLGTEVDGVVDRETLTGLARVSKKITTAKAFSLRDHRRLESLHEALRGREVVLVPSAASSATAPDAAPPEFTTAQDEITMDVAVRAYDLLRNVGAVPVLVDPSSCFGSSPQEEPKHPRTEHDPAVTPWDQESESTSSSPGPDSGNRTAGGRVSVRTQQEALAAHPQAVVLCLQCDWNRSPHAQGVATFYWGDPATGQSYAPIGHKASDMILRELVARTGALDLGSHARQWSTLRSAGAATAWVDLGYLSSPVEREQLRTESYRSRLAESLLCGLQRVTAPAPEPTATGTMSLADIEAYYRVNPRTEVHSDPSV